MIEQVRALLKDKNVSTAVIVDDAYDSEPTADDLVEAQWNSFFDDLSADDEQRLKGALGDLYDELDATELAKRDEFVQALWRLQVDIEPSKELFARYHDAQSKKRSVLEPLVKLLSEDLNMTCHKVGRESSLIGLGGQVIFLDLYMGFVEQAAAMRRAAEKVRILIEAQPKNPPSVILLSQSSDIERLASQLRDDAAILGCQFRWINKTALKQPGLVAENIYDLVRSYEDAITLNNFIRSWNVALDRSQKAFMKNIRSLDLADYANVSGLILEAEGQPLGDYILDIYDLHLHSLIEGDSDLAEAAKRLSKVDWKGSYPPAQFMPSAELNLLMDGALFHNQIRTDAYVSTDRLRTPRFGEVFLGPELPTMVSDAEAPQSLAETESPSEMPPEAKHTNAPEEVSREIQEARRHAYIVLSQACDLQHKNTDRLLLLQGNVEKYSWAQHDESRGLGTPIMRVGDESYSIDWDVHSPETWLLSELGEKLDNGYLRARTFRMPFALQIQQAFIGKLGRVGTIANLPTRYVAGVRIYAKAIDETAISLLESGPADNLAVCLVGRTEKNKLKEWLLLSSTLKETLRIKLQDLDPSRLYKETPGLRDLKDDPEFLRALNRGLLIDRGAEKGSRPLKGTKFDAIQIFSALKLTGGASVRGMRGLIFEIDFKTAN